MIHLLELGAAVAAAAYAYNHYHLSALTAKVEAAITAAKTDLSADLKSAIADLKKL
jgi:hypothetical protein